MEIRVSDLKNGDKGVVEHWVNQPGYVGNIIEMKNGIITMIQKNGFKTESVDMRYPYFCKVKLMSDWEK